VKFEWDPTKAASNLRKHRVSFEEASTIWSDENRIVEPDLVHTTEKEYREQLLGLSQRPRLLVVIFTEVVEDDEEVDEETVRIITARRATKAETRRYLGKA
jgi:uncharacterized protein